MLIHSSCYFIFITALLWNAPFVHSEAHPHQGVVTPFQTGDPGVKLDGAARKTLGLGKPYSTQIQSGSGGRGLVVQDVHAPTKVVWGRILDFNSYNKMVPKTAESEIYARQQLPKNKQERIWVRMKIGFPMLKIQFFVNHLYDPMSNSLTWTLDYSKKSELDDSCGFWYVIPHPDNPTKWSRVYYSVEISVFDWMPKFVVDFLSKKALTDATAWVKKYSELEAAKLPKTGDADNDDDDHNNATTRTAASAHGNENSKRGLGALVSRIFQKKQPDSRPKRGLGALVSRIFQNKPKDAPKKEEEESETCIAEPSPQEVVVVEVKPIGVMRYLLVFTVLLLAQYNLHLYLSQ